jgi:hypothetical protein
MYRIREHRRVRLGLGDSGFTPYGNNPYTHIYNKTPDTPHLVICDSNPESGVHGTPGDRNLIHKAFSILNPELHSHDEGEIFSISHPTPGIANNYSPKGHLFYTPRVVNKHLFTFNKPEAETAIITPDNFSDLDKMEHIVKGVTLPQRLTKYFAHKARTQTPIGLTHENIMTGDWPKNEQQHLNEVKDFISTHGPSLAKGFLGTKHEEDRPLREQFANYLHNRLKGVENYPDIIKVLTGVDKL